MHVVASVTLRMELHETDLCTRGRCWCLDDEDLVDLEEEWDDDEWFEDELMSEARR